MLFFSLSVNYLMTIRFHIGCHCPQKSNSAQSKQKSTEFQLENLAVLNVLRFLLVINLLFLYKGTMYTCPKRPYFLATYCFKGVETAEFSERKVLYRGNDQNFLHLWLLICSSFQMGLLLSLLSIAVLLQSTLCGKIEKYL